MGTKGKGAAVKDTRKTAKINLTQYFAGCELTISRRELHDQFEAIALDVVNIFKVCTMLPEEWHHELKSIAKSVVDVFVILVHAGEVIGVKTYKATRRLTHRRVAAQKKFARTTQNRMCHKNRRTTHNTLLRRASCRDEGHASAEASTRGGTHSHTDMGGCGEWSRARCTIEDSPPEERYVPAIDLNEQKQKHKQEHASSAALPLIMCSSQHQRHCRSRRDLAIITPSVSCFCSRCSGIAARHLGGETAA